MCKNHSNGKKVKLDGTFRISGGFNYHCGPVLKSACH
jgi:uncharacterized protein YjbJ (UPF0337 family)